VEDSLACRWIPAYVGVLRSYTGMYWGLLHRIAPDIDAQRLLHSFSTAKHPHASCEVKLGKPEIGNYLLGMPFFSNGKLIILRLQGQALTGICDALRSQ